MGIRPKKIGVNPLNPRHPRSIDEYTDKKTALNWRFNRQNQRHSRPARSGGGDPLIMAVGESALEIFLERMRASLDGPRTIGGLIGQEVVHAALISAMCDGYSA